MMVCTSIYSVVDGLFVANIVGSDALASINIVMPLFLVLGAFGFMLGTGRQRRGGQDHGGRAG